MPPLVAGVARANITPPVGMLMAGYGARKTPAVAAHDELYTAVLYLTDGTTEAAIITADILYVDAAGTARIREACTRVIGVPAEHVFIACSHTHGGPQTSLDRSGPGDELKEAYSTTLLYKMVGALHEAKRGASPVSLGYARQDCSFGMNRRERRPDGRIVLGVNPSGPTVPFAEVMRLDRLDTGEPLAVVFCYACHGTTLGGDNLLYTADFPGFAKQVVEREIPSARALFVAGCSGDINPQPRGDFAQCERHGRRLGGAVVQAALDIEQMDEGVPLAVALHRFSLPVEAPPPLETAKNRLRDAEEAAEAELARARDAGGKPVDESALNWLTGRALRDARALVQALEQGETDLAVPVEAQAVALGDCAVVGLPAEVFVRIGMEIAETSPFARTIPVSHANGGIGYIPTADEVPLGGYEVDQARARNKGLLIRPEAEQATVQGALVALGACFSAHGRG
jgi:hypothetical protein